MKKFVRLMVLVLVAVMLCAVLAACGGAPAEDPKDAKKALKDNDFNVELMTDKTVLAGYEYDGLVAILEADRYDPEIDLDDEDDVEDLDGETLTYDYVYAYYFKDEKKAEKAFKKLEDKLNDKVDDMKKSMEKSMKAFAKTYDVDVEIDFDCGEATLDGCIIYVGTSGALSSAS